MLRKERLIDAPTGIEEILKSSRVAHLAFIDHGWPAIVPMSFGYEIIGGVFVFYFHGAAQGRKSDAWRNDSRVSLEITGYAEVIIKTPLCHSTCLFASVIADGQMEIVEDDADKIHGLDVLMKHCGANSLSGGYPDAMLKRTAVFKFTAESITGKSNRPQS